MKTFKKIFLSILLVCAGVTLSSNIFSMVQQKQMKPIQQFLKESPELYTYNPATNTIQLAPDFNTDKKKYITILNNFMQVSISITDIREKYLYPNFAKQIYNQIQYIVQTYYLDQTNFTLLQCLNKAAEINAPNAFKVFLADPRFAQNPKKNNYLKSFLKTAIENDSENIILYLINNPIINLYNTYFIVDKQRLNPLEYATYCAFKCQPSYQFNGRVIKLFSFLGIKQTQYYNEMITRLKRFHPDLTDLEQKEIFSTKRQKIKR